ncbi:MAG: PH domain-containing protein [Acidobacteria bacterium]|nr:PH domain-containing protein [Acidobacteriota bacterium]
MSATTFRAPWSRALLISTSVQALLLLAVCAATLVLAVLDSELRPWERLLGLLIGVGLPLTILGMAARFAVRGYTVSGDSILVHRLGWSLPVDAGGLEAATIAPYAMRRSVRELGNGGLFAYTGRFRNARLGSYRAFVTDHSRTVVLRFPGRTGGEVLVMSPDDPQAFVALLADRQGSAASAAGAAR